MTRGERGVAGAFERAWSGAPGAPSWTKLLLPLAAVYGAVSGLARRRAESKRERFEGAYVLAVGNLTVGGAGKSTIARWLAAEAVRRGGRAAILMRGYRATPEVRGTSVVPDFEGYDLRGHRDAYGDEAIEHRVALPRGAVVAVDPDRLRAARAARSGYGAQVLILDDGWEQGRLRWNELWVAVDPLRPEGNGALLPAGPLRRPAATLREASRVVMLLEEPEERISEATRGWLARHAPHAPLLRFARMLRGVSAPWHREAVEPLRSGIPVGLVSGIGAPERLERFVRGAGAEVRSHAAFPDHARFEAHALARASAAAVRAGAEAILLTEKDEPRWPSRFDPGLPVRVLRTEARPLDPIDEALAPMAANLAGPPRIG